MTTGDEMSESKHTPGPLTVKVNDKWPYNIETFNAAGDVVFSRDLPCNGTGQKSAQEAMAGVGMPADWNAGKHNARALADEVLRAAAPDMLETLQAVRDYVVTMKGMGHEYQAMIDAAIAKATGAA
jgi:hypothetical protein